MASRKLQLVERADFAGWACSGCGWVFNIPTGIKSESLDDLIREIEARRDAAFAAHACARYHHKDAKAGT